MQTGIETGGSMKLEANNSAAIFKGATVLLIGGNGFIGSHLQDELKLHGYRVRVLDRSLEKFRIKQDDIEYIEGEFTDNEALSRAIDGCDLIVHLAQAITPLGTSSKAEYAAIEQSGAFARMLDFINYAGVKNIIYFSSGGAVYGNPSSNQVTESSELNPVSPYGVSKLMMEKYLQMYAHLHDMKYLIIRPSNPYGPRQNFRSGQGVIPIFMRKVIRNETVTIWGDGTATKDYIYIDDLVVATRRLLETGLDNNVYNIASGVNYSLTQLLNEISSCTDLTPNVDYKPVYKSDVQKIYFSCEKLIKRTGWKPRTTLKQGLKKTRTWLQETID